MRRPEARKMQENWPAPYEFQYSIMVRKVLSEDCKVGAMG
jgi:hypothetical protein